MGGEVGCLQSRQFARHFAPQARTSRGAVAHGHNLRMANTFRPRSGGTHAAPSVSAPQFPAAAPLDEHEIDELQDALDAVPAPLEPLDVSMVDGFLCGVLLQPQPVAEAQWLPHITDADGRALPASFDATGLHALVRRRHAELSQAIADRQWFDPWVFEMEEGDDPDGEREPTACDAVYPWVAGFATAQEFFPALMRLDAKTMTAPLALLYRHLDPEDLEDADELLAEIESLEPPSQLADAVEELVRATLLLADLSRPRGPAVRPGAPPARGSGRRR